MVNSLKNKKKIEKILLLSPARTIYIEKEKKRSVPPMGLLYLGAVLQEKGYHVKIVDAIIEGFDREETLENDRIRYGLDEKSIGNIIDEFQPQVVGISSLLSAQHHNVESLFRVTKQIDPGIITVTGGAHPSALPVKTLECQNLDFVILGEGELSFPLLLEILGKGKDPGEVDGIAYRKNGDVVITPKKYVVKNLDDLPLPARHLLPMKKYSRLPLNSQKQQPLTYVISSRGCPFNCSYCASRKILWGNYRYHSAERMLHEIKLLHADGYKEIQFFDDNLTANKPRTKKLFQGMIKNNWNISWATPNGISVKGLDQEMIELMKESGCYKVILAIESGNQYVLNKIARKPINLEKVPPIVQFMKKIGIQVEVLLMIGFPGETRAQIMDTINFAKMLEADYTCFYIVTPLPGTEIWDVAKEKGYLVSDDVYRFNYSKGNIKTPEFTPEFLEKLRFDAWREVNFGKKSL